MNFPSLFPRTFPMLAGRGCAYHEYGASAPASGRYIAAATDAASVCKDAMFVQQAPLGGKASSSSCGSGRGLSASESDTSASSSSSNSAGGLAPQRAEGGGGGGDSDAAGAQPKAKKTKVTIWCDCCQANRDGRSHKAKPGWRAAAGLAHGSFVRGLSNEFISLCHRCFQIVPVQLVHLCNKITVSAPTFTGATSLGIDALPEKLALFTKTFTIFPDDYFNSPGFLGYHLILRPGLGWCLLPAPLRATVTVIPGVGDAYSGAYRLVSIREEDARVQLQELSRAESHTRNFFVAPDRIFRPDTVVDASPQAVRAQYPAAAVAAARAEEGDAARERAAALGAAHGGQLQAARRDLNEEAQAARELRRLHNEEMQALRAEREQVSNSRPTIINQLLLLFHVDLTLLIGVYITGGSRGEGTPSSSREAFGVRRRPFADPTRRGPNSGKNRTKRASKSRR